MPPSRTSCSCQAGETGAQGGLRSRGGWSLGEDEPAPAVSPGGAGGKEAAHAGPQRPRAPEGPLEEGTCLENPVDRGAGGPQSLGVAESDTTQHPSNSDPKARSGGARARGGLARGPRRFPLGPHRLFPLRRPACLVCMWCAPGQRTGAIPVPHKVSPPSLEADSPINILFEVGLTQGRPRQEKLGTRGCTEAGGHNHPWLPATTHLRLAACAGCDRHVKELGLSRAAHQEA